MFSRLFRERSRSRAVKAIGTVTAPAEPDFDRFVQQIAEAFAAPIALLTLIDDASLWIGAATGMAPQCIARDESFCTHAVDGTEPLEVCDAHADPLYAALPAVVGAPFVRYYIGAPLVLFAGTAVGALCVLDTQPRLPASRDQRAYLVGVARQAAQALERRAHVRRRSAA
jgi:GAF domain-containing protein